MHCHQARERLNRYRWLVSEYSRDTKLMEHLQHCFLCSSLVQAERTLDEALRTIGREKIPDNLPPAVLQEKVEAVTESTGPVRRYRPAALFRARLRRQLAIGLAAAIAVFLAFVPFNFTETVGYEVAVSGIDRNIALDNKEITSLLGALGMAKDKAATLLDSLEISKVHIYVGECRETCHLKIADLKTEKDVRVVVQAILDLGCCEIDKIIPVFRNESSSLLKHATRRLFS
ncbi:MAG: hypothetical protein ACOYVF_02815 [Candidatus Zixiibacteriota bacterium]